MFCQAFKFDIKPTIGDTAPTRMRSSSRRFGAPVAAGSPKSSSSSPGSQRGLRSAVTKCALALSSGRCTWVTAPWGAATWTSRRGVFLLYRTARSVIEARSYVRLDEAEEENAKHDVGEDGIDQQHEHHALRHRLGHDLGHGIGGEIPRIEPLPAAAGRHGETEEQALEPLVDEVDRRGELRQTGCELPQRKLDDERAQRPAAQHREGIHVEHERQR